MHEPVRNDLAIDDHDAVNLLTEQHSRSDISFKKSMALLATGTSIIAVLPVPYLVARSVFYLITRQTDFTFQEMLQQGNITFLIFGPSAALMATIAIAPFNMVNAYNTVISIKFTNELCRSRELLRIISGFFLTFTGAVNAYNVNYALNDVLRNHQSSRTILRFPCVSIGLIFAGISDARVLLLYLAKDSMTDYRYVKRGATSCYKRLRRHSLFFLSSDNSPLMETKTRNELLLSIRQKLDDLKMIIMLALHDTEINQLKHLYENQQWINDVRSSEFESFSNLLQHPFPLWRFIGSEVIGSVISGTMAYYGNQNTYEYTYKAVSEFLGYCCMQSTNWLLRGVSDSIAAISFITGFCMSFFLIRDLFFRDIFKSTTVAELLARSPILLLSLVPAFSFGLLNVILTALNENLSPLDKVLVSCAAILGATVVTRFGVEGGIEQLRGKPNIRRELAAITDKLMDHFVALSFEELNDINEHITVICQRRDVQTNELISPQAISTIDDEVVAGNVTRSP